MDNFVVYIDEDVNSRRVFGGIIEQNLSEEVDFFAIEPSNTVQAMLEKLEKMPGRLVSVVIDERLYATGTADFTGSDFVEAYRQFDDKLPIYILTNHPGDIDEWFSGVEYILSKSDVADDHTAPKIFSRILRHINVYITICDQRNHRFRQLIGKSIDEILTEDEAKELDELRRWRVMGALSVEQPFASHLKGKLDKKQQILDEIESLLRTVGH